MSVRCLFRSNSERIHARVSFLVTGSRITVGISQSLFEIEEEKEADTSTSYCTTVEIQHLLSENKMFEGWARKHHMQMLMVVTSQFRDPCFTSFFLPTCPPNRQHPAHLRQPQCQCYCAQTPRRLPTNDPVILTTLLRKTAILRRMLKVFRLQDAL